ncbi:DotU family type IV/VI secretion system protein, partial [Thermodesulfobacteriota bacterium]
MTLLEITSDLFLYLVTFRRKVRKKVRVDFNELRFAVDAILSDQQSRARSDPKLGALYETASYPLIAMVDEIVLNSNWEHTHEWLENLLEYRVFGTQIAGDEFFLRLDREAEKEP